MLFGRNDLTYKFIYLIIFNKAGQNHSHFLHSITVKRLNFRTLSLLWKHKLTISNLDSFFFPLQAHQFLGGGGKIDVK